MGRKKRSETTEYRPQGQWQPPTWMPERGGFQKTVNVGLFIRDYLLDKEEGAPISEVHRAYKDAVVREYEEAGVKINRRLLMTYQSFCQYYERFKLLGFIELADRKRSWLEERSERFRGLAFYRLTDRGKEAEDYEWSDAVKTLYGSR